MPQLKFAPDMCIFLLASFFMTPEVLAGPDLTMWGPGHQAMKGPLKVEIRHVIYNISRREQILDEMDPL